MNKVKDIKWDSSDIDVKCDEEKNIMNVFFDKTKTQVSSIISKVMDITEVQDIQIKETELAEIVKEIYNHGV